MRALGPHCSSLVRERDKKELKWIEERSPNQPSRPKQKTPTMDWRSQAKTVAPDWGHYKYSAKKFTVGPICRGFASGLPYAQLGDSDALSAIGFLEFRILADASRPEDDH
jgi:hypothetical protein